jgi:hypothetical protein
MPEFVSLGENCLPDDVLSFVGKKNESYPFGSGRFNIEYIIQIIESDFAELMNPEYLIIGKTDKKEVVRNTLYSHQHPIYSDTVTLGFEFTHHNVLEEVPKKSFTRKIHRFRKALEEKKELVFIYHYRYNPAQNPKLIIQLLENFLELLAKKYGSRYKCVLWYQNLEKRSRGLKINKEGNVLVGEFSTLQEWEGDDLWNGSSDRDLFTEFFESKQMKQYVFGSFYFLQPLFTVAKKAVGKTKRVLLRS